MTSTTAALIFYHVQFEETFWLYNIVQGSTQDIHKLVIVDFSFDIWRPIKPDELDYLVWCTRNQSSYILQSPQN